MIKFRLLHPRGGMILLYDYAVLAIIQPDRSFEVARVD